MKIFKYALEIKKEQQIKMPIPCKILTFQMQNNIPTIWAVVDELAPERYVTIVIKGTGHDLQGNDLHYIGTAQDGALVWHCFHRAGYELFKNQ